MDRFPEKFSLSDVKKLTGGWNLQSAPSKKKNYASIVEIQSQWNSIAGETLSVHSYPYKIQSGLLFVRCDHSIFAQQFQFFAPQIIKKIEQTFHLQIKTIKTTIGVIYWKNPPNQRKESDNISSKEKMAYQEENLTREEQMKIGALDQIIASIQRKPNDK